MKEKASHADSKDEKNDGAPKEKGILRKVFDLSIETNEFVDVMELVNAPTSLSAPDLETVFDVLINNYLKKMLNNGEIYKSDKFRGKYIQQSSNEKDSS